MRGDRTVSTTDFFKAGRTYTDGNGYRAPEITTYFHVEHVTRHPERGHLRAIGWSKSGAPEAMWYGNFQDDDEADGWTELPQPLLPVVAEGKGTGTTGGEPTPTDFYQPDHTYRGEYGWAFRCDTVTTHPEDGERSALGWRYFNAEWNPYAYGPDDWETDQAGIWLDTLGGGR